jgi:hypothetical protein
MTEFGEIKPVDIRENWPNEAMDIITMALRQYEPPRSGIGNGIGSTGT